MDEKIQQPNMGAVGQQLTYPLDFVSQEIIKKYAQAFPVGSVFISTTDDNPVNLLGYGTWEAFGAGRVLVGLDSGQTEFDTLGETGGAKTHTLTVSEMPAHSHSAAVSVGTGGNLAGGNTMVVGGNTGSAGGDGAHNNLQPYIVVRYWKRTA